MNLLVLIKHRDAVDLIRKLVQDKAQLPDDTGKIKELELKNGQNITGDLASELQLILVRYFDGLVFNVIGH